MELKTIKQINTLLNINLDIDFPVASINIDSRTIKPGEVFWSLPGFRVDGEDYVEEAFSKGASAAVVSNNYKRSINKPLIKVNDRLEALQLLAKRLIQEAYPKYIVAITGSVGKTSTKEFLATLLESTYTVFKTPANQNTKISLPLQILNGWNQQEVLVLEMGMTHPGDLTKLISIAPPDIALINTVALTHAENFNSLEDIARAKAEIFSHSRTKLGFYGKQIEKILDIKNIGSCEKRTFGIEELSCDYALMQSGDWSFKAKGDFYAFKDLPKIGKHQLHNLLAAMSIAHELKVPLESMRTQIDLVRLPERRFERKEKNGVIFFDDSYNASEESMIAAFKSLPEVEKGSKKIAVLGSMMELGRFSQKCHQNVAEEALHYLDHLFCYGEECQIMVDIWKKQGKPVELYSDHKTLIGALKTVVCKGDIVLLKGSKSKQMWKVFEEF